MRASVGALVLVFVVLVGVTLASPGVVAVAPADLDARNAPTEVRRLDAPSTASFPTGLSGVVLVADERSTATQSGALTTDDRFDDRFNGYYDVYQFDGTDGETVSLEVRVGDADAAHATKVFLVEPGGPVGVETADVSADGSTQIERYELPESGTYTVVVATQDDTRTAAYDAPGESANATFPYELRLHRNRGVGAASNVAVGDPVTGSLSSTDSFLEWTFAGYYDAYSFDGERGERVSLAVRVESDGGGETAELTLVGPDGSVAEATNASTSEDARVERYELPESGTYTVVVATRDFLDTSVYGSPEESETATFGYVLSVDAPPDDPSLSPVSAPTAEFVASATSLLRGETVTFDASASTDDGAITAYEWDVDGDDTVDATGETVEHAFDAAGTYTVSLTVTDDAGATNATTRTVTVTEPEPEPEPEPPSYAGADGVVQTGELRNVIAAWVAGDVGTSRLRDAIAAWVAGTPL